MVDPGARLRSIHLTASIPGSCSHTDGKAPRPVSIRWFHVRQMQRATVQPTAADLKRKRTFLEDNAQFPRKVKIV